jgi:tetratricopeptide (TPR) repeat protein
MRTFRVLCVCVLSVVVGGCAGIGPAPLSVAANDLREAADLYGPQDRPVIAEKLIREAMETYRNNDDQLGLAEAYRSYGFFLRSQSVEGRWSQYYREHGFLDRSVTFDIRYEKSIAYLEQARAIFERYGRFDAMTNINLNIGFTYEVLGYQDAACEAFDRSVENNRDSLEQNAKLKVALPKGFDSYEDFLAPHRKRAGCEAPHKHQIRQRSIMSA